MRHLAGVTKWLFILTLPPLVMTATIAAEFNSIQLYRDGFEKYRISQVTGLADGELDKAARGLIDYFNADKEYIQLTVIKDGAPFTLFNEREVGHLKDVKALIQLDYRVLIGTAIYVGLYAGFAIARRRRRDLFQGLFIGGSIILAMLVALGIGTLSGGFDELFLRFHFLAFTNDLWLLDPSRDYLIMLFPEGFWFDTAMLFGQVTAGAGGALLASGLVGLKRLRTGRLMEPPAEAG